jgi:hypothetical protein
MGGGSIGTPVPSSTGYEVPDGQYASGASAVRWGEYSLAYRTGAEVIILTYAVTPPNSPDTTIALPTATVTVVSIPRSRSSRDPEAMSTSGNSRVITQPVSSNAAPMLGSS